MPSRIFRRTRWLIDSDVQVRLSIRLGACVISYLVLFCLLAIGESLLVVMGFDSADLSREAAVAQLLGFSRTVFAPLMFAVACMVLHGVLLLHRLAGPIYRVRRGLEALSGRALSERMNLRKGDYLSSVAELYNGAMDCLQQDLVAARSAVDEALAAGDLDQAKPHLEQVKSLLSQYRLGTEEVPADATENAAEPAESAAV